MDAMLIARVFAVFVLTVMGGAALTLCGAFAAFAENPRHQQDHAMAGNCCVVCGIAGVILLAVACICWRLV